MMAYVYPDTLRSKLRRLLLVVSCGPTGAFMRAAIFGACGVLGLASVLPGSEPVTVTFAFAFSLAASGVAGWVLHRDYPHDRLGMCNYLTLVRLFIVSALMAPLVAGADPSWPFFALAALALSLDGVDGWLARRQGLVSDFGARFDVEVDSLLALVLALSATMQPEIGLAVVLLGVPRYAFLAATLGLPWMRRTLPERFSRKVVCVLQLGVLIALQAPIFPHHVGDVLVPAVALLLIWSFTVDIVWLWRRRA